MTLVSVKSLLLSSSAVVVGCVLAAKLARRFWLDPKGKKDPGSNDSRTRDGNNEVFDAMVPTHLKRLLYKEKRRKESVRLLAMKKPMYDNIEMYSLSDILLCTISNKKADWYIRKNIAKWKVETKSIQLAFEPHSHPSEANTYNRSHKQNICVVCGDADKFMRHYVVPYCYRTLFPTRYKTHTPHDIVILCPDCHLQSEKATQKRVKELETSLRVDPGTTDPQIPDRYLRHVRSLASALSERRDKIPSAKLEEYEMLVKQHFGLESSAWLSNELLVEAMTMETSIPNPSYIPGPLVVVSALASDEASIGKFIIEWRNHFVDTMQPRFLPVGWSIHGPVHNDQ